MVASTANRPPQASKSFTSQLKNRELGNRDGSDFCCGAFNGRDWICSRPRLSQRRYGLQPVE